jgi:hypothetical protein
MANAAVKLAAFDLTDYFDVEVGAYGTDHADRNELVPIALKRVERLRGERYLPEEVWVIGDTPGDWHVREPPACDASLSAQARSRCRSFSRSALTRRSQI